MSEESYRPGAGYCVVGGVSLTQCIEKFTTLIDLKKNLEDRLEFELGSFRCAKQANAPDYVIGQLQSSISTLESILLSIEVNHE